MNPTIYKQLDSRWSSLPYPTRASSFGGNGCGCCACVHIAIEQESKKKWTPATLRPWMVKQGYAYPHQGTTWNGITETLEYLGHKKVVRIWNDPMSEAWKELNKGNRIGILLVDNSRTPDGTCWTASGHYVAFTDYNLENGKHWFYIKDSGGRGHDGWFCYEKSIKGALPKLWIVERLDAPKPTPAPTPTPTPEPTPSDKYTGEYPVVEKYLEPGDKGAQVTRLQNYLNWYTKGKFFKECGKADGTYGKNTLKYVKQMQTDFFGKKEADGLVGNKTIAKMKEVGDGTTPTPSDVKIKGMDISTWQGKISVDGFKKAKADGIKFVILRVGFTGVETRKPTLDNCFENNYKNAKAAGLKIGYYYYTTATDEAMAKKEAEFTLKNIKGKQCDYPVYFDIEDPVHQDKLSSKKLAKLCDAFCDAIQKAGYKPGVYASTSWFSSKIGNITVPHTKWVAQYYKECQYKGDYDMWQYTSSGTVVGIGKNIDLNWCYKKF